MGLATYALKMAAIAAPAAAILALAGEPMPTSWLYGIVDPGASVGKAAVVLGMWVAGAGSIVVGGVVGMGLARDAWRLRADRRAVRPNAAETRKPDRPARY